MAEQKFVKPIVEFFELNIVDSRGGKNFELFWEIWDDKTYRYLDGAKGDALSSRKWYYEKSQTTLAHIRFFLKT